MIYTEKSYLEMDEDLGGTPIYGHPYIDFPLAGWISGSENHLSPRQVTMWFRTTGRAELDVLQMQNQRSAFAKILAENYGFTAFYT